MNEGFGDSDSISVEQQQACSLQPSEDDIDLTESTTNSQSQTEDNVLTGEPNESSSEESDGKEKTSEEILRETLSSHINDVEVVESLVKHEPNDPLEMHPVTVFKLLVAKLNYLWFDLFVALGMEFKTLEAIRQCYPINPNISLFEAITEWLRGDTPTPSWKALVDVLRHKMLEAKLADSIAEKHFSAQDLENYKETSKSVINETAPPTFEEDDTEFSKLLLAITDQLGPDSFPEFRHFLKELYCPDGSRYVNQSYLKDQRSPEGLLIQLLYNNLLVSQDLDLLIVLLRGLGRDDLMHLLHDYSSKLTVGYPIFRPIQDTERFFSLIVELQPGITELDLEGVSYIKREVCEMLGVEGAPYLLQFLGWKKAPIIVQFQVHMCLVDRVGEVVHHHDPLDNSLLENFARFEMDVRGSVFTYDLSKIKYR